MISIIIPVKNDNRINKSLERLTEIEKEYSLKIEIIICGTGNYDIPNNNIRFFKIDPPLKGKCIKRGISESKGEYIIVTDADLPVSNDELVMAIYKISHGSVVFGSRKKKHENKEHFRNTLSKISHIIIDFLFKINNIDTQCGFKAFEAKKASKIATNVMSNGFAWDIEFVYRVIKYKYKYSIVSASENIYLHSKINLFTAIPLILFEISILYWNLRIKKI